MAKWKRVSFEHAVVHVVCLELFPFLVSELGTRGHPLKDFATTYGPQWVESLGPNPKDITEWSIDIGGACHADRPSEMFQIGGMPLAIPCEDVAPLLAEIRRCERREFTGMRSISPATGNATGYARPYYKLHGWNQAIVLTPSQYNGLRAQMLSRAPAAHARGRAFYEEVRRRSPRATSQTGVF